MYVCTYVYAVKIHIHRHISIFTMWKKYTVINSVASEIQYCRSNVIALCFSEKIDIEDNAHSIKTNHTEKMCLNIYKYWPHNVIYFS